MFLIFSQRNHIAIMPQKYLLWLNNYLSSTYYIPETVLNAGYMAVSKVVVGLRSVSSGYSSWVGDGGLEAFGNMTFMLSLKEGQHFAR